MQKVEFYVMLHIVRWVRQMVGERHFPEESIRLANLAFQAYQRRAIARSDFYRLLMRIFPYHVMNTKHVKIFLTLMLGYRVIGLIQRLLRRLP